MSKLIDNITVKIELSNNDFVDIVFRTEDNLNEIVNNFSKKYNLNLKLKENLFEHLNNYTKEWEIKKKFHLKYKKSTLKTTINNKSSLTQYNFFSNNKKIIEEEILNEKAIQPSNNILFKNKKKDNSNYNNFNNLYDSKLKNNKNIKKDMNFNLNHLLRKKSSSYLNDKFYYKSIIHEKIKNYQLNEIKKFNKDKELIGLTFKPKINNKSEYIQKKINHNKSVEKRLLEYGEYLNSKKLKNFKLL